MNYWNIVKYALSAVFLIIVALSALFVDNTSTDTNNSVQVVQPNQPKFNF